MPNIQPPCTLNDSACIVCTEVAPVAQVSDAIVATPIVGWNGGATTVAELSGDIHTVFTPTLGSAAEIVGFLYVNEPNIQPTRVTHGFFVASQSGVVVAKVIENGVYKTSGFEVGTNVELEIRRVAGVVSYFIDGEPVYTSATRSSLAAVVNACLYASGDGVE